MSRSKKERTMTTASDHISRAGEGDNYSLSPEAQALETNLYCLLADAESATLTDEAAGAVASDMCQDAGYLITMEVADHIMSHGEHMPWGIGPASELAIEFQSNPAYYGPGPGPEQWDAGVQGWRPAHPSEYPALPESQPSYDWQQESRAYRAQMAQQNLMRQYCHNWPVQAAPNAACADGLGLGLLRCLRARLGKAAYRALLCTRRRAGGGRAPNPRRAAVAALRGAPGCVLSKAALEQATGIKKGWSRIMGAGTKATQASDTLIGRGLVRAVPGPAGAKGLHYQLTPLGRAAARHLPAYAGA